MHQEQKTLNTKYLTLKKNINNNDQQIKCSSKVKENELTELRKE